MTARLVAERLGQDEALDVAGTALASSFSPDTLDPDVPDVLLARQDPEGRGVLRLLGELRREEASPAVVVAGVPASPSAALRYLEAGAASLVPDDAPLERLVEVVRAAGRKESLLPPPLVYRLVRRLSEMADLCARSGLDPSRLRTLTPREREVLELLGRGLSNREIADELYIEVGTVKTHVHHLLRKLEVGDREQAARYLLLAEDGTDRTPGPEWEADEG